MKNIFIIGSVASGKTTISKALATELNMTCFDTGLLFRFITWIIINKTQINPSMEKVIANKQEEIDRITEDIYGRRKALARELNSMYLIEEGKIIYKNIDIQELKLFDTQINNLVRVVAQSKIVRKYIVNFIRNVIGTQRGKWILTGHTLFDLKLSDYIVVYLHVNDENAAKRLLARTPNSYVDFQEAYSEVVERNRTDNISKSKNLIRNLYNAIYLDTNNLSEAETVGILTRKIKSLSIKQAQFVEFEHKNACGLSEFKWMTNPFLQVIKEHLQKRLPKYLIHYPQISSTDIMYQLLIHLCAYTAQELFIGNSEFLELVNGNINKRRIDIFEKFHELVYQGEISLNENLITKEIDIRIQYLYDLVKGSGIEEYLAEVNKGKPDNSSSSYLKKNEDKFQVKQIDSKLSSLIFHVCHYLHTPRSDEYLAYGLFYKDQIIPLSAVSFSLHDRDYKKQILDYIGLEANNVLEVTRAWCSNNAPQNAQSYLLEQAMTDIRKLWREKKRKMEVTNVLQGFTTTIDPNLDFHASSFAGCNFQHFALRPAKYNYIIKEGINFYKTRREIAFLSEHSFTNKINVLPLNEMIRVFDESAINEQHRKFIYKINDRTYERIEVND